MADASPPPGVLPYRPADNVWLQRVKVGDDAGAGSDIVKIGPHRFRVGATLALTVEHLDSAPIASAAPPVQWPRKAVGPFALDEIPVVQSTQFEAVDLDPTVTTQTQDETELLKARLAIEQERNRHAEAMAKAEREAAVEKPSSLIIAAPGRQLKTVSFWIEVLITSMAPAIALLNQLGTLGTIPTSTVLTLVSGLGAVGLIARFVKQTIALTAAEQEALLRATAAAPMKANETAIKVQIDGEHLPTSKG